MSKMPHQAVGRVCRALLAQNIFPGRCLKPLLTGKIAHAPFGLEPLNYPHNSKATYSGPEVWAVSIRRHWWGKNTTSHKQTCPDLALHPVESYHLSASSSNSLIDPDWRQQLYSDDKDTTARRIPILSQRNYAGGDTFTKRSVEQLPILNNTRSDARGGN